MKAVSWKNYGPPGVLALDDVSKPNPKSNEVLIRVVASTVNSGDCRIRGMNVPKGFKFLVRLAFGFNRPKKTIPGMEFSGVIEDCGDAVTSFKHGDKVFGTTGIHLGAMHNTCV